MRRIKNEPNWENMFDLTVAIARSEIKNEGQQKMVAEMLLYGKRLHIANLNEEEKNNEK
jgi:hypothetical protein|tara:strand:+ start:549 stop:725 length:177 start_codon:yes stop_codon:yes gene_type:complete